MSKLQVETISHTNNTTAMTVDSSGRVNISNVPRISAYHSTDGNLNTTTGESFFQTSVTLRHQTGITYSNDTNGRFTVPIAGTYYVHFKTIIYDRDVNYQIRKNDSQVTAGYISGSGKGWNWLDMSVTDTASASDYYTVFLQSQSGGSGGHYNGHGGIAHNAFDIVYVGG
jgi:hypothetical protein